jgi:hypothetical protein
MSTRITCILSQYNASGFGLTITILPWDEDPSEKIIMGVSLKRENQLAALNDCIYREKGRSRYVFHIDLDEYIVQRGNNGNMESYQNMLRHIDDYDESLGGENKGLTAVYQFRNVFFSPSFYYLTNETRNNNNTNLIKIVEPTGSHSETGVEGFSFTNDYIIMTKDAAAESNVPTQSELNTIKYALRHKEPHSERYR